MDGEIPVIDISGFGDGTGPAAHEIARLIDDACQSIGFLVVTGHGIKTSTLDGLHGVASTFFDLSQATKNIYQAPEGSFYGYIPMESSTLAYSLDDGEAKPDLREAFASSRPDIATGDPYFRSEAVAHFGFDVDFPSEVGGFHATWTSSYYALSDLAARMMKIFAVALGMPLDYFDASLERHASNLALFNYPEQTKPPQKGQLRGGAHTDFGSLTLVHSDWSLPGGLEVQLPDGRWIAAPNVPGAFIVNLGDMMARWTNDRWVSTMHRVANPPAAAGPAARRQSAVFFHVPDYDAIVSCIPSCATAANPAKYQPITVANHHMMKMGKMFEEEVA
ncbi:MAG: 2-oxoglutarate and iron-dependent oxygenase domain-containing protein [Pseudomonadota bacterium]